LLLHTPFLSDSMSADSIQPLGGRSLSSNAAWAVAGNLVYVAGRFLIVVLLTKCFSSDQVGRILYAMAVATPLSFFFNMETRSVFVTDVSGRILPGHCLAARLGTNLLYFLSLTVLCFWLGSAWGEYKIVYVLLIGGIRAAESFSDAYLGVFQKREHMKYWAVSQSLRTVAVLIWALVVSHQEMDIGWFPAGCMIVTLVVLFGYDRPRARKLTDVNIHWDRQGVGNLLRGAFPLGVFVCLSSLNTWVAPWFIAPVMGDASVAYFSVLMNYVTGAASVQNGINQAILSRLAIYFERDRKAFVVLLLRVLGLCWLGMILLWLIIYWRGAWILNVFHKSEYASQAGLFSLVIFSGGIILTGMITGDAVIACRRYKSRLLAVTLGVAANALVCYAYLPTYGLYAAAWAAVVSSSVIVLICTGVLITELRNINTLRERKIP